MKPNIKLYITILYSFFVLNSLVSSFNIRSSTNDLSNPSLSEDLQTQWTRLFTDPNRNTLTCKHKKPDTTVAGQSSDEPTQNENGVAWAVPRKKPNYYAKEMIGWGPSSYLFDFLDDVLQKEMIINFKKIYLEAKLIKPDKCYKDPYTLENITQMKGTQEELIKKLGSLMTNSQGKSTFDYKSWENSITCAQINVIMTKWKWYSNKMSADPAKQFVDKFDFNGDGRLNPKEFIIGMIMNNQNVNESLCKNCMESVIKNFINPIFAYLDCTDQGKINAENIWHNLQKLKRSNQHTYNFFTCDYQEGNYRTSTVNDFIQKSKNSIDGYLNKNEFKNAILQGYWARHVNDYEIKEDDSLSLKSLRWANDGQIDKVCESLKNSR